MKIEKYYKELEVQYNFEKLETMRKGFLLNKIFHQSRNGMNIHECTCDRILSSNSKVKMKVSSSDFTQIHKSPYYRVTVDYNLRNLRNNM